MTDTTDETVRADAVCEKCGKPMVHVDVGVYAHTSLTDVESCGRWRAPQPRVDGDLVAQHNDERTT